MALYTEACTVVRTDAGLSESFEVKVDLHQGSVLSPLWYWQFCKDLQIGVTPFPSIGLGRRTTTTTESTVVCCCHECCLQ